MLETFIQIQGGKNIKKTLNPFLIEIKVLVIFSVSFPFCKTQNFPLYGSTNYRLLSGQK